MPDATYVELTVKWRQIARVKVSRATIVRKVLSLGYTQKKKTTVATERLTPKNKAKRAQFLVRMRSESMENLVFLDEAGFQAKQGRRHARSPRGKKAVMVESSGYPKNYTMVGAIRLTGPFVMRGSPSSMTTKRFLSFLQCSLFPRLRPGDTVVMDNLRAHRNKQVRRLARAWDLRIVYLPPYSPEHNPIEQVWGWMKNRLRYRIKRAAKNFRLAISEAWRKASELSYKNLFRRCGYALSPHAI